jgi:hypothetical protein
MLKEAEYVVQQYYTVRIDEKAIDKHIDAVQFPAEMEAEREKEKQFSHRLFHAIMADRKALNTVLEYMVLCEQGDGASDYVNAHFEKEIDDIADILLGIKHCFSSKDQTRLEEMKQDSECDIYTEFEALTDAFQWEPSGFHVAEHACARKEGE